jgi:hypothetical protein
MDKRRRPRALTLTLPDEHQPHLVFQGKQYTLRNLSEEGIGVWVVPPAPYGMKMGSRLRADFVIDKRIYPVELEVAHESERLIGLKILHKSGELEAIFNRLLQPSFYAAGLERHQKSEQDLGDGLGPRLWYTGRSGVELLVWYHEFKRMILAVQITWAAKWVYRAQFKPAKVGFLGDQHTPTGLGHEILRATRM